MSENQSRPPSKYTLIATLIFAIAAYSFLSNNLTANKSDERRVASEDSSTNSISTNNRTASSEEDTSSPSPRKNDSPNSDTGNQTSASSSNEDPNDKKLFLTNKAQVDQYVRGLMAQGNFEYDYDESASQVLSDSIFKIYRYTQKFQGYPVFAAELKVFVSAETSQLIRTQSSFVNIDQLPAQNYLNSEEAVRNLANTGSFADKQVNLKSEAVSLLVKNNQTHFVYSAEVQTPNQIGTREVVLFDAHSGQVITRYPNALK